MDVLQHAGAFLAVGTFLGPEGRPGLDQQPLGADAGGKDAAQGEQLAYGARAQGGQVEDNRRRPAVRLPVAEVGGD